MSRTLILTLAAAATITVASFASSASYAHGFGGGGHASVGGRASVGGHANLGGRVGTGRVGTGRIGRIGDHPGHGYPGRPGRWAGHGHGHWIFRGGRWIVIDPVAGDLPDAAPVSVASPGPCTCLTKTYTQDGLVVFADVCTKEAASARIGGASSDATPVPPANSNSNDTAPVAPAADATQAPTTPNYAGLTYQDFLKANGQAKN
jgi:hypothetical protein